VLKRNYSCIFVQHSHGGNVGGAFHRKDYDSAVMRKELTYNIVTKFHPTGLMMDRKKSRKRHVLTEEKLI
jgi:hypothetical protein